MKWSALEEDRKALKLFSISSKSRFRCAIGNIVNDEEFRRINSRDWSSSDERSAEKGLPVADA